MKAKTVAGGHDRSCSSPNTKNLLLF